MLNANITCSVCVLFVVAAPVSADPAHGGSVKLWRNAVVVEKVIRLGDVAELRGFDTDTDVSLKDLVLTAAPDPGGSRIIALSAVREALAHFGVNRAQVYVRGAAECAVRRPVRTARPIPEAPPEADADTNAEPAGRHTLREVVTDYFDQQLAAYGGQADISFGRTSAQVLELSSPEFTFRVRRKSGSNMGLIHVEVAILRGASEVQRVPLVLNVALIREVVVAHKAINRGATVRAEDVRMVPQRFTRPGQIGMADPGAVIGLRAQRFIPPGEMLGARDLERVPLVRRGQIVEVLARFGTVTIKTAAKVTEDGDYGELVTLHLPGRRKAQLTGRVVGPRCVRVGYGESPDGEQMLLAGGAS